MAMACAGQISTEEAERELAASAPEETGQAPAADAEKVGQTASAQKCTDCDPGPGHDPGDPQTTPSTPPIPPVIPPAGGQCLLPYTQTTCWGVGAGVMGCDDYYDCKFHGWYACGVCFGSPF